VLQFSAARKMPLLDVKKSFSVLEKPVHDLMQSLGVLEMPWHDVIQSSVVPTMDVNNEIQSAGLLEMACFHKKRPKIIRICHHSTVEAVNG